VVEPAMPLRVAVIGVFPDTHAGYQPQGAWGGADRGDATVARTPGHLIGEILNAPIAESPLCGQLHLGAFSITGLTGSIVIEVRVALVTVNALAPFFPWNLTVTVVAPTPAPVESPLVPATLLTFAMAESAGTQFEDSVISLVFLFLKLAVACNCTMCERPTDRVDRNGFDV